MINFIFNVLNFLLLISVIVYIFYKYLLNNILNAFQEDKADKLKLNEQNNNLDLFQEKLEQSVLEQDIRCKNVILKIEKWANSVSLEKEKKNQESNNDYIKIKEKLKIQHNNYQNKLIQEESTAKLLEKLEFDLNNYFSDKENLDKYFDNIFHNKLKF